MTPGGLLKLNFNKAIEAPQIRLASPDERRLTAESEQVLYDIADVIKVSVKDVASEDYNKRIKGLALTSIDQEKMTI